MRWNFTYSISFYCFLTCYFISISAQELKLPFIYQKSVNPLLSIKKNLKGTVNFWTYNQMYQKSHIGKFIYYLNLFLLIFLIVYCISSLLFAWIGFMQIPIFAVSVIVGILEIPAIFSAMIYKNKKDLGRQVVFFKVTKYPGGKGRTAFNIYSIFNFLFCLIPIAYSVFILSDFIYM